MPLFEELDPLVIIRRSGRSRAPAAGGPGRGRGQGRGGQGGEEEGRGTHCDAKSGAVGYKGEDYRLLCLFLFRVKKDLLLPEVFEL